MERFKQRLLEYNNALIRLKEGLEKSADDDLYIDGILQRFEFTFELAWKSLKDYLEYQGIIPKIGSPREIIKTGFEEGIIENGEEWIEMMLARNTLSHIYDEIASRKIYEEIRNEYVGLLENLVTKLNKLVEK